MANQRTPASAQKAPAAEDPATDMGADDKTAEVQAIEAPAADEQAVHTDTSVNKVAPLDGPDHGYIGQAHPDKNRYDYTVAGVTGGTAKAGDKPQDGEDVRKAWAPLRS